MFLRNCIAVVWFILGAGWGYWAYRFLARRYGRRRFGRFSANWAAMTGLFLGMGGCSVLWNGGHSEHLTRQGYFATYDWHWPEALGFALTCGLLVGGLLTWRRPLSSYAFDIPSNETFIDSDEVQEILSLEKRASAEECRRLAESLLKQSRRRLQPLPPEVEQFVERYIPTAIVKRTK